MDLLYLEKKNTYFGEQEWKVIWNNWNLVYAIKAILDGISQSIKRNIGSCVSAKELWVKLEKLYSNEEIAQTNLAICKCNSENITEDE